jgi:hypothetical protein
MTTTNTELDILVTNHTDCADCEDNVHREAYLATLTEEERGILLWLEEGDYQDLRYEIEAENRPLYEWL